MVLNDGLSDGVDMLCSRVKGVDGTFMEIVVIKRFFEHGVRFCVITD